MAEYTGINTTANIKHTQWVEQETFPGSIALFAGEKEERALKAKKHTGADDVISFWMDMWRLDST